MGERAISPMGHVRMMAAVQPFLSGPISKTVNLPETATVEEIEEIYFQGWKLGLKALAIYRDNCKVGQPLSRRWRQGQKGRRGQGCGSGLRRPRPRSSRRSSTARSQAAAQARPSADDSFTVGGAEGYMTAGSYDDGGSVRSSSSSASRARPWPA
jgi:ribonucleoside-diphosphate reductase alpha chain